MLFRSIRDIANIIIDTSQHNLHDLRRNFQNMFNTDAQGVLRVNIISFGFKYNTPKEAELLFDLRFLPNPYFVPELKEFTGQNKDVANFIFAQEEYKDYRDTLLNFLHKSLPLYEKEGRYHLCIAFGCT